MSSFQLLPDDDPATQEGASEEDAGRPNSFDSDDEYSFRAREPTTPQSRVSGRQRLVPDSDDDRLHETDSEANPSSGEPVARSCHLHVQLIQPDKDCRRADFVRKLYASKRLCDLKDRLPLFESSLESEDFKFSKSDPKELDRQLLERNVAAEPARAFRQRLLFHLKNAKPNTLKEILEHFKCTCFAAGRGTRKRGRARKTPGTQLTPNGESPAAADAKRIRNPNHSFPSQSPMSSSSSSSSFPPTSSTYSSSTYSSSSSSASSSSSSGLKLTTCSSEDCRNIVLTQGKCTKCIRIEELETRQVSSSEPIRSQGRQEKSGVTLSSAASSSSESSSRRCTVRGCTNFIVHGTERCDPCEIAHKNCLEIANLKELMQSIQGSLSLLSRLASSSAPAKCLSEGCTNPVVKDGRCTTCAQLFELRSTIGQLGQLGQR